MAHDPRRGQRTAAILLLVAATCTGAWGASRPTLRPARYRLDVTLDPATNGLTAHVTIGFARIDGAAVPAERETIDLLLHPELALRTVSVAGATLREHTSRPARGRHHDAAIRPTRQRLVLDHPTGEVEVTLDYAGRLRQDVSAGEREGEIHNFAMAAHVGAEGIYLAPEGYWYPRTDLSDEGDPALGLAGWELTVAPVEGLELVASLERRGTRDGRIVWASPFSLDGLVLLGGPLARASRTHGSIDLSALLPAGKADVAEDLLDASEEVLDRYQPLIGPYPFREFTVLESFFSAGFAFPASTQISGEVLGPRKMYRRHGYLDHELLHNWWGNGVLVDPRDGNWCEALASYLANYYGHVLDGNAEEARKERRNQSNFLSALEHADDKPLGTFGREGGAGRGIGYSKGAAVFHMLERKIGEEALFAALRQFAAGHMGRHAGWDALRQAAEAASGDDLAGFFEQWVRKSGAPQLRLEHARWDPEVSRLTVTVRQGEPALAVDLPLRLHYGERAVDAVVPVTRAVETVVLEGEPGGPNAVELDPDYHVFRRLAPSEAMPTSSLTRRTRRLVVVLPRGEVESAYDQVVGSWSHAVRGEDPGGDPKRAKKKGRVIVRRSGAVRESELRGASVLAVGDAVRDPAVAAILARAASPVTWTDTGFRIGDEAYERPGHAVLLTLHHPDREGEGVTVYHGNAPEALGNAGLLTFYPNSLLVFDTPPAESGGGDAGAPDALPRAQVARRMDFEFHDRIELRPALD